MNKALEQKMVERWPTWFKTEGDIRYTLMPRGFTHDDGWFDILWRLCEDLEPLVAKFEQETGSQFEVLQVKEKFGGLRFYVAGMKRFANASESPQASHFTLARFAGSRDDCGKTDGLRLCATSITPLNMHRFADRWGRERIGASPWDKITMSQRCLETAEGTLTERLLRGFLASLTTMLFVIALPFLLGLLLIPTLPPDERWLLKMAFTFLSPFSAVLWFIAFRHLVLGRRAGYFMQLVVFIGTAAAIYLLLINGVYHL